MAKPTIVLVPGSFSAIGVYDDLVVRLKAQGYPAVALVLPSTQKRAPLPPATLEDDVAEVKIAVETLIALGREVVVMAHSYGGTPTTEALVGLNVKRIIYMTAVAPKIGQSQNEAMGMTEETLPPMTGDYMHLPVVQYAGAVINDMPWEEAYRLCLQFPHHSAISMKGRTTQAAYVKIPVSYIITEKDMIISPELQEGFIKNIEEGSGKKPDVYRFGSGHCPNFSMPEKLVEVLVECAEK